MGKRSRRRDRDGEGPASFADLGLDLSFSVDADALAQAPRDLGEHGVLTLRTGMSPGTRAEYDALRKGLRSTAASTQEDRWARAVEFLYERLVVQWEIAGVVTSGATGLLRRYRVSTPAERAALRDGLRAHLAEHLPDVEAP